MKIKKSLFLSVLFFVLTGYAEEEIERKTRMQVAPPTELPKYREVDRFDLSVILNATDVVIAEPIGPFPRDRYKTDMEEFGSDELTVYPFSVESFVGGENAEIEGEIIFILSPYSSMYLARQPLNLRVLYFIRKLTDEEIQAFKDSLTATYQRHTGENVVGLVDGNRNKIGEWVRIWEDEPIRLPSDLWVWAKRGSNRRWSSQRLGDSPGAPIPRWKMPEEDMPVTIVRPIGAVDFLEREASVEVTEPEITSYLSELMKWMEAVREGEDKIDSDALDPLQKMIYRKLKEE